MKREIRILDDAASLARVAAGEFVRIGNEAVRATGRFTVALAGGSTPKLLYSLLASEFRDQVPWHDVYFFFADERHAGPDDPDSNFRMAKEAMLSKLSLNSTQVLRVKAENPDASQAAADYQQILTDFFKLAPGQVPSFDLVLLGMGNEGHTASLFPGTNALHEKQRLVVSNWVGKLYTLRITMTAPVLCNSAHVIFMITGKDKALALKGVLEGPYEPEQLPAQMIQPRESLLWLVDREAGSLLDRVARNSTGAQSKKG
ncbi:MAG: 6-phosphogluconolactonase [Acidobacteria bacterium]|nr:6-phosphogluconolactonase [Acidobacteriota bacterium]